ncbi:MAG: hypothetical protein JHC52_03980 [Chthoniobacterales bacterium]|nr:hypothetical protein [Chthoniobacterales bacterium]
MARFADRTKRITRRMESEAFARYVMPPCWLLGFVGLAGVIGFVLEFVVHGRWEDGMFKSCAGITALPFVALLVRFLRGHFAARIKDT